MKIKELRLLCADLEAMRRFYADTLGLQVIAAAPGSCSFAVGGSVLTFCEEKDTAAFYHFAMNIVPQQVTTAYQWTMARLPLLKAKEGTTLVDFPNWNAKAFYFLDPQQNIVECIARFDLDVTAGVAGRLPLLAISEVGLVAHSVLDACAAIRRRFGLDYFERQPPRDDFSVLGTHSGLLIVVPPGRCWYPTQQEAGLFPLDVDIVLAGERQVSFTWKDGHVLSRPRGR